MQQSKYQNMLILHKDNGDFIFILGVNLLHAKKKLFNISNIDTNI